MKLAYTLLAATALTGVVTLALPKYSAKRARTPQKTAADRVPVLVELFTSEGCSSCPSADDLLKRLQTEQPVEGAMIVPLSEHVDYWNTDRWRDRFSSQIFSSRQVAYVQALHANGSYTPQMVVNGTHEFVGSDESEALETIRAEQRRPQARIEVTPSLVQDQSVDLKISVKDIPKSDAGDLEELYLAVAEDNLSSQVLAGENEGRHLAHTAVVRRIERVGAINASGSFEFQSKVPLDPHWKQKDLSIVAFVQNRQSRRIGAIGLSSLAANEEVVK